MILVIAVNAEVASATAVGAMAVIAEAPASTAVTIGAAPGIMLITGPSASPAWMTGAASAAMVDSALSPAAIRELQEKAITSPVRRSTGIGCDGKPPILCAPRQPPKGSRAQRIS